MNSKKSIFRKYRETVFLIITIILVFISIVYLFIQFSEYNKECELISNIFVSEQESIFKYEVERAVYDIDYRIKKSVLSLEDIKKVSIEHLREIRFPNSGKEQGFFFIRSFDGIQMLSVSVPDVEGKDVSQYKDPEGIITHELFMDIVNASGEGFADYSWFNPATGKNQKKRSFIKKIPELQWYIGAGFWFEDINSVINVKKANLRKDVRNYVLVLFMTIVVLGIIIFIVLKSISDKINNNFKKFSSFFSNVSTKYTFIEKENLHYLEFDELADSANKMILEHKEAEKKIRESEALYRQLFNSLPYGGEIIDTQGIIVNCSLSTSRMLGYEMDEIIGKHITNFVDEKTIKLFKQNFPKLLKGESLSLEACMINKNGSKLNILRAAQPIFNADKKVESMLSLNIDITARKKAEEELKKLSKIVETTSQNIIMTKRDGTVIFANIAYLDESGYTNEEVIGKSMFTFSTDEGAKILKEEVIPAILNDGHWFGEITQIRKDKSVFQAEMICSLIENELHKPQFFVGIFTDITERKKTEQELAKNRENLEEIVKERTKEIEEKNKELIHYNKLFEGREIRIKELKDRVKELEEKLGIREDWDESE